VSRSEPVAPALPHLHLPAQAEQVQGLLVVPRRFPSLVAVAAAVVASGLQGVAVQEAVPRAVAEQATRSEREQRAKGTTALWGPTVDRIPTAFSAEVVVVPVE